MNDQDLVDKLEFDPNYIEKMAELFSFKRQQGISPDEVTMVPVDQYIEWFNGIQEFIGQDAYLTYESEVKLTGGKKNEQLGRVKKVVEGILVHINSGNEYKQAMIAAGNVNFEPQKRTWGVRLDNGFIAHKDELYIEFLVKGKGKSYYTLDNVITPADEIIGLPVHKVTENEKQDVILRSVKATNILKISCAEIE